ncbi:aminotransferase class III-fold pyridoxal phosphate-dependent enzyme [Sulfitobacter profundi]|uniref:Aminotransferase class III-fold pyridoxal phosphate-dependent enzyme n=1 Tax=Sulfitobacter profundi TaxID=2679961 RepID=A0ABW1Z1U9_9RHOB
MDGALSDQAGASILSGTNEPAVALAERLLQLTPGAGERRVWLGHSGSDANETVARVVPAATGRTRMMAFSGAYHGGTQGSMAVSGHTAQEGSRNQVA